MPASFPRTLRHLEHEEPARLVWTVTALGLVFPLFVAWSLLARVEVVEPSAEARIELREPTYPIVAPVGGRVARVELALGGHATAGQLLVELDTELERRRMTEAQRRHDAVVRERLAVDRQIEATTTLLRSKQGAALVAVDVAEGYESEARVAARLAEEEVRRDTLAGDTIPELERVRSHAAERRARALLRARSSESVRVTAEQRVQEDLLRVELEQLRREAVALEGEAAVLAASLEVLAQEIEARRIRAATNGTIGSLAPIQVGTVLAAGERVGTIVEDGELELVATFPAARALGRVAEGQPARMRVDAFPWTEFGVVDATVRRVASEHRDGLVSVELEVVSAGRIPLQHGLTGVVEVEVEHVAPARILLRAAGR